MVVEALLSLVYVLLDLLFGHLHIPQLPTGIDQALQNAVSHIVRGVSWFAAMTHYGYIKTLFVAAVAIEGALLIYKIVMWILRKIPAVGIKD